MAEVVSTLYWLPLVDYLRRKLAEVRSTKLADRLVRREHCRAPPMPEWTLHDFRRLVSTAVHDQLGVQPHIVEAVGHVGHLGGTQSGFEIGPTKPPCCCVGPR